MKTWVELLELFDTKVPMKVIADDAISYKAKFKIDKKDFLLYIKFGKASQVWEIIFFRVTDAHDYDLGLLGDLNAKQTLQVFSAVKAGVKDWFEKQKPEEFKFSAKETEKSRVKIYDKFAKIMAKEFDYKMTRKTSSSLEGDAAIVYKFENTKDKPKD